MERINGNWMSTDKLGHRQSLKSTPSLRAGTNSISCSMRGYVVILSWLANILGSSARKSMKRLKSIKMEFHHISQLKFLSVMENRTSYPDICPPGLLAFFLTMKSWWLHIPRSLPILFRGFARASCGHQNTKKFFPRFS